MFKHSTIIAVIAAFLTGGMGVEASCCQTLHFISAADTRDPQLGIEFNLNNQAMHDFVTSLVKTTNLKLDVIDVSGGSYSCSSIENAIKSLSVAPDDIIIFFHSGHGNSPRRDANDDTASIFPSLECATAYGGPVLNLADLSTELIGKKARLTIVGADSCNNILSAPAAKVTSALVNPTGLSTMFIKYEGSLLIASSSPGEYSYYPDKSIGLFTKQFIDSLNNPPGVAPDQIWEEVIARATRPISLPANSSPPQDKQHPPHREELRYLAP